MRRSPRIARIVTVICLLCLVLPAPARAVEGPVERARERIRALMVRESIPGLTVAVAVDGRLAWSEAFGYASLEHHVPATPSTKFRVASVSKALSSAAVGLLLEAGKLDLDAPVQTYVPTFPQKAHPLTTRQLAAHLSGIPQYGRADIINRTHYASVTDSLRKFQDRPLLFAPGERFEYSSFAWNLIGAVIEGAAGKPFLEYMATAVFQPLGMRHTVPDDHDRIVPERTAFYQVSPGGDVANAPWVDNSDLSAAGRFLSTSEDLVRFGHAVVNGAFLRPETLRILLTPAATNDGKRTRYGLGWEVLELDGRRVVGHRGSHVGTRARLVVVPEKKLAVAALVNCNSGGLWDLVLELTRIFLE
jgi:serine beta-lactamase-like protein LACTB